MLLYIFGTHYVGMWHFLVLVLYTPVTHELLLVAMYGCYIVVTIVGHRSKLGERIADMEDLISACRAER